MNQKTKPLSILIAEDDEDDCLLIREALKEAKIENEVHWVKDGEELITFISASKRNSNGNSGAGQNLPGLILLDLNMPKKDGREVLEEIKSDPIFRKIPVIIMTTSSAESDIARSYDLGVNSFIQKPARFQELVDLVDTLFNYWLKIVMLPK